MKEIKFEITKHLGVLSENGNYQKQANMIRWNDNKDSVFDLRTFRVNSKEAPTPLKGVVLNAEELEALKAILNEMGK